MTTQLHTEPFTARHILIQKQTAILSVQANPSLLKTLPPVAVFPHINVLLQTSERNSQPQFSARPVRVSGTPKDLDSILWLCACVCVCVCL